MYKRVNVEINNKIGEAKDDGYFSATSLTESCWIENREEENETTAKRNFPDKNERHKHFRVLECQMRLLVLFSSLHPIDNNSSIRGLQLTRFYQVFFASSHPVPFLWYSEINYTFRPVLNKFVLISFFRCFVPLILFGEGGDYFSYNFFCTGFVEMQSDFNSRDFSYYFSLSWCLQLTATSSNDFFWKYSSIPIKIPEIIWNPSIFLGDGWNIYIYS